MAGVTKTTVVKKVKKHGVKAGQKSLTRPSQKKAVKNGRHQEKELSNKKVKKTVASIPADLDGEILDDNVRGELTSFEDLDSDVEEFDEYLQDNKFDNKEIEDIDEVNFPDKEY